MSLQVSTPLYSFYLCIQHVTANIQISTVYVVVYNPDYINCYRNTSRLLQITSPPRSKANHHLPSAQLVLQHIFPKHFLLFCFVNLFIFVLCFNPKNSNSKKNTFYFQNIRFFLNQRKILFYL